MNNYHHLQLLGHGGYAREIRIRWKVGRTEEPINCNSVLSVFTSSSVPTRAISTSKVITEQQKKRLEAEKQILQQVKSPFLCQGFTSFETVDEISILLEYVEGRALYECVWNYRDTGKFSENVTKYFAAQLVLALKDLHAQGYIHRDLKSGNVLVGKDGFAKVIDFGLAWRVSDVIVEGGGRTLSMCGTHYIMAPEIRIRQQYGFEVDWWSLGVVIYEMVIGRPPWEYKCPYGSTVDEYFEHVTHTAKCLFHGADESTRTLEQGLSIELRSLIRLWIIHGFLMSAGIYWRRKTNPWLYRMISKSTTTPLESAYLIKLEAYPVQRASIRKITQSTLPISDESFGHSP
uniref:Protein kinase domain-containing protein n=1 Tax=Hyaloperonospora arabidopsidis (strain Emoy2) TaxID=559515 RepID=M4B1K8_HYAAE